MNLFLRLVWLLATARFRPRCDMLGPCRTRFRVWLTDLDVLGHVNNGVYLSLMDLGRVDLLLRSGVLAKVRARGWHPVVAAETIQFRRSLTLLQPFVIETRVLGWDDRSIFLEQRFVRPGKEGETIALSVIRGRFLTKDGSPVPMSDLMALSGHNEPLLEIPEWVGRWNEDMQAATREGSR
jgi:acyl-CoA thioesterase FadM